jgi:glycosyltransferase involved in cell wall biosynthesis
MERTNILDCGVDVTRETCDHMSMQTKADARPRVAAVIPCYNAARHIGEAIGSILSQTYEPIDVIVVNDGSTDDFDGAIAPFRDRITVIEQPNSGQAAARNRALAAAEASYVAFLDADDRWHPEKIARQVAHLEEHPECGLVHTVWSLIDGDGRPVRESALLPPPAHRASGDCLLALLGGNAIVISSVVVRRRLLAHELFAVDLCGVEDWDMWVRLATRTRFARIDEPLTDYRVHQTNFSSDTRVMSRATVKLMEGVLARETDHAARRAARVSRHEAMLEVANREYEHGNYLEARRWFRDAFPRLRAADMVRYCATFLPAGVFTTARSAWRGLTGVRNGG